MFLFIVPITIGFLTFYQGQETKVAWSFAGIFILILIFLSYYVKYKSWYKTKKQAHETARNLGQVSHTTNFFILGLTNFLFTSIPFAILILLESAIRNYEGNISVHVGYLLISVFVSQLFDTLYYYTEQTQIKERLNKEIQEQTEQLAKNIRERI